jgi:pimeloyl-ACP methyl ester carboxylesterase
MPYASDLYYQAYQAEDTSRLPLVLIHGAGGDHLSWPSQLRRLPGCRVFAPDLPGHGKSRGHAFQRVGELGQLLVEWLLELGLSSFFLAGHSLGGAAALWIAQHHPDLIRGLILISTGASLPVNLTLIEELATPQGFPIAVEKVCRWSFSPAADPRLVEAVQKAMLKTRPSVLGADFRACDAWDMEGQLAEVGAPTLILVGENDKMTPVRFSEELQQGIRDAELAVVPGAGHMLPLERPDEVARLLRGFLEGTGRG